MTARELIKLLLNGDLDAKIKIQRQSLRIDVEPTDISIGEDEIIINQ
jgi:hypothetical protein